MYVIRDASGEVQLLANDKIELIALFELAAYEGQYTWSELKEMGYKAEEYNC